MECCVTSRRDNCRAPRTQAYRIWDPVDRLTHAARCSKPGFSRPGARSGRLVPGSSAADADSAAGEAISRPAGLASCCSGLAVPVWLRPISLPSRRRRERIVADVERARAEGLKKRSRKLDRVEQTAIRVIAEGKTVAARIAAHERERAATTSALARRQLNRKIGLLRELERRGLVENVGGHPRPSAKPAQVYALAKASGARREASLKEMGLLSDEQAAARRAASSRFVNSFVPPSASGLRNFETVCCAATHIRRGREPRHGSRCAMPAGRAAVLASQRISTRRPERHRPEGRAPDDSGPPKDVRLRFAT
jgi:hypothetical protein